MSNHNFWIWKTEGPRRRCPPPIPGTLRALSKFCVEKSVVLGIARVTPFRICGRVTLGQVFFK